MPATKSTLDFLALYPEFTLSGGLRDDSPPIVVAALVNKLAPGLPLPPKELKISEFTFSANPKYKTFQIEGEVINVWSLDLGSLGTLGIEALYFNLDHTPRLTEIFFRGDLDIIGKHFILEAQNRKERNGAAKSSEWTFKGALAEDDKISLTDLMKKTLNLDQSDLDSFGLASLELSKLAFTVITSTSTTYIFEAGILWDTGINFDGGENLKIESFVTVEKEGANLKGQIAGKVAASIPLFDSLEMNALYTFQKGGNSKLNFTFILGNFTLNGVYEDTQAAGDKKLSFNLKGTKLPTFGDMLSGMVQLMDPTEDEFELDPPWDVLNGITLNELTKLSLEVNLSKRSVKLTYTNNISPDALEKLGVVINGFSLVYTKPKKPKKSSLLLEFEGSIFGKDIPGFDPVNGSPPEVPGGTGVFVINYLGMGQHVSLRGKPALNSINEFIEAYKTDALPVPADQRATTALPPGGSMVFDKESGWLIGAQLELIKTIKLSAVFNDPYVYGLRLELAGPGAKVMAGLKFEILYVRINDNLGKYHVDLTLPDLFRYLQFGAVSITLPVIVVDIYTNGDFKLDLGFPWKMNFARSFAIEVFPFTGAGGFYFNKLSAATATSTPKTQKGIFDPVIEFGIGLKIGLGKSFNKGPLKAEISITVQGMLEGVISWFEKNEGGDKIDYFFIKGAVAIVGRVYGAVDFKVIKVEVEVLAKAMVQFVVESHRASLLVLSAEVSVSATVTVVFIKVKFSFGLKIVQRFTLGSDSIAPWDPSTRAIAPAAQAARTLGTRGVLASSILDWAKKDISTNKETITLFFQPAASRNASGPVGIALLYIENSIPFDIDNPAEFKALATSAKSDFDKLALACIHWAVVSYLQPSNLKNTGSIQVALEADPSEGIAKGLKDLYDNLLIAEQTAPAAFDYVELLAFLKANFDFEIKDCKVETPVSAFPMFSELSMNVDGGESINFTESTVSDVNEFQNHFRELQVLLEEEGDSSVQINEDTPRALTDYLLMDYVGMIIRMGVQQLIDEWESDPPEDNAGELITHVSLANLLKTLNEGGALNHLSGMVSRFLLHGLRMPKTKDAAPAPLYEISRQQFEFADKAAKPKLILKKQAADELIGLPEAFRDLSWITLKDDGTGGAAAGELAYEFPDVLSSFIQEINGDGITLPKPTPALLPFFVEEQEHFPIQQASTWAAVLSTGASAVKKTLFTLPNNLLAYLKDHTNGVNLSLHATKPSVDGTRLEDVVLPAHRWATQIPLRIKKTSADDTGIYELIGVDEYGKDLLEVIFAELDKGGVLPQIILAHSKGKQTLVNAIPSECFIIKTNLSTETHATRSLGARTRAITLTPLGSTDLISAPLSETANFLRLIWEVSTVNTGGYYLYYDDGTKKGFPEEIFTDDTNASLSLILFPTATASAADLVQHQQTCLIFDGEWDNVEKSLRVETGDTYLAPAIPAGHFNLQVTTDNSSFKLQLAKVTGTKKVELKDSPAADAKKVADLAAATKVRMLSTSADAKKVKVRVLPAETQEGWLLLSQLTSLGTAANKLHNLYQLLGYKISGNTSFNASKLGLPAGPKDDDPTTNADDAIWTYERAVPYFRFAKNASTTFVASSNTNSILPKITESPYAGIGKTIKLDFFWQDLFGNHLANSHNWNKSFVLDYKDPLIGLNQWPNVKEQFIYRGTGNGRVELVLSFQFDTSPFEQIGISIKGLAERVAAAKDKFRQVYYQIHDKTLAISVNHSLTDNLSGQLTQAQIGKLRLFVDDVYVYLSKWGSELAKKSPESTFNGVSTGISKPDLQEILLSFTAFSAGTFHYPTDFTFPLTVDLEISRASLSGKTIPDESIRKVAATLSPKATDKLSDGKDDDTTSLRAFAGEFEKACPGLHLAISRTRINDGPGEPDSKGLFVVQLGDSGIKYNVEEDAPVFFAIPPLANTLSKGEVMIQKFSLDKGVEDNVDDVQRFESIDLNILAREFLFAVEDFLDPDQVIIAFQAENPTGTQEAIKEIIKFKLELADIIVKPLEVVLKKDQTGVLDFSKRAQFAAEKLRQQLAIDLVSGFDIETVVQYPVNIQVNPRLTNTKPVGGKAPRIAGKPTIKSLKKAVGDKDEALPLTAVDFTLSSSKISLDTERSYLTFLFNTQSPEKYEGIKMKMAFEINDLEHEIKNLTGIRSYEASDWLSFIRPIEEKRAGFGTTSADPNDLGETEIPIPLKYYPVSPSLVSQKAVNDESSEIELKDIRQWQYSYTYEHPNVAQDAIATRIETNIIPKDPLKNRAIGRSLFEELVNFSQVYPQILPHLLNPDLNIRQQAIVGLKGLISQVKTAWGNHTSSGVGTAKILTPHYLIDENLEIQTDDEDPRSITIRKAHANLPTPFISLPNFDLDIDKDPKTSKESITYFFKEKDESNVQIDTGDSSIPDRTLSIPDLDIINTQNIWGGIWLIRNQFLIKNVETNPKFVFRTPFVQFNAPLTPLLINDTKWDIATLSDTAEQTLAKHIENMFAAVLPHQSEKPYSIRLSCKYGFAMAEGAIGSEDLMTFLPVLMGIKFDVPQQSFADPNKNKPEQNIMAHTTVLRENLKKSLEDWLKANQPVENKGLVVFTLSIFSALGKDNLSAPNLPLLKIEHLGLRLKDIL